MLIKSLNVTLADLMPLKGVAVMLTDEGAAYRISERLHGELKKCAVERGVTLSQLLSTLRTEIHTADAGTDI